MNGSKWRKPENGLPEFDIPVLISANRHGPIVCEAILDSTVQRKNWFFSKRLFMHFTEDEVEAWKPLPEPPEWMEGD